MFAFDGVVMVGLKVRLCKIALFVPQEGVEPTRGVSLTGF